MKSKKEVGKRPNQTQLNEKKRKISRRKYLPTFLVVFGIAFSVLVLLAEYRVIVSEIIDLNLYTYITLGVTSGVMALLITPLLHITERFLFK